MRPVFTCQDLSHVTLTSDPHAWLCPIHADEHHLESRRADHGRESIRRRHHRLLGLCRPSCGTLRAHAMPDVLQRSLDSCVDPGGILFRHPHRQTPNLRQHSTTTHATSGVRPLPGDELPMPAKQRVRSHDGRDLPQSSTAQRIRAYGESAPIVVAQLQVSAPQLAAKHTILFKQITKDISFLAIQPPGEAREQQLQRGGVEHGRSLYHGPQVLPSSVDPVMGHYALTFPNYPTSP
jgi:hypothetical protein